MYTYDKLIYDISTVKGCGLPVKLVVGGLHGREWTVSKLLEPKIRSVNWSLVGCFIFVPRISFDQCYRTTLSLSFYRSEAGLNLIWLLRKLKPSIYVEIHGYSKNNLRKLVDPLRLQKRGVPSFFQLRSGLLVGSVSPITLSLVDIDVPLALELPLKPKGSALTDCMRLLRIIARSKGSTDLWRSIAEFYDEPGFKSYLCRMRIWIELFRR
ncbi:MAG: DUF2119 family protein [Nitrososphaerota archaeon]|nr:DUF2119 domain-containing protein [Candidatus Bathyarchaeota archaeon]MCX8161974.1 DUF2119 domain-containing protein [Candidatus Bathyarchaeota archaeon]MDW8061155.1 DUF2119 family protein [Nitrososphaerota archaeon]